MTCDITTLRSRKQETGLNRRLWFIDPIRSCGICDFDSFFVSRPSRPSQPSPTNDVAFPSKHVTISKGEVVVLQQTRNFPLTRQLRAHTHILGNKKDSIAFLLLLPPSSSPTSVATRITSFLLTRNNHTNNNYVGQSTLSCYTLRDLLK